MMASLTSSVILRGGDVFAGPSEYIMMMLMIGMGMGMGMGCCLPGGSNP